VGDVCEGFAVLHHPRYAAPASLVRVVAATVADPAPFVARLSAAGLARRGQWWTSRRLPVARLALCAPSRVEVAFADLSVASVASLREAAAADVFPTYDTAPRRKAANITPAQARARRAEACGCVAVLENLDAAAALVVGAAATCYGEACP